MNINFKVHHFLELQIFCNIINVFTVTFDQFNAYMLNSIFFSKTFELLYILCKWIPKGLCFYQ